MTPITLRDLDAATDDRVCELLTIDPRLAPVAAVLRELLVDDSVSPLVYWKVCEAVFAMLELLVEAKP